ncbi:MAG TPA: ABC transporter ATP-binding protein [Sphingobacteriaceae bacterium]|nr:ABC transporter ATP-binding protein [Sphingobacteriaceae bacterium]
MTGEALLQARDLVVGYTDLNILHGVHLTVHRGEIVTIIGPNGAGKSTLAKTVVGLLRPRRGSILFDGNELAGMSPSQIVRYGISYVPQVRNVFPNLTVRENLEVGGYLLGRRAAQAIQRIYEMFPDLAAKDRDKAGTLSGGQRQMLAMGRALILDPKLLVLDEPSAGLSPKMVEHIFTKIQEINAAGCTILMVEQNARRALAMSRRGYVLDMGRNAMEDTGENLLSDPRVIDLYLGQAGSKPAAVQQQ